MAAVVVNVGGGSGGKQIISGRMRGATPTQTEPLFIQWGTGAGTAAVADTALFSTTTTTEARTTGTSSQVTGAQTNSKWRVVGTITAAGARTITEVGLFDTVGTGSPPTGGNFFLHADHGSTTLASGDSITYTIDVDFTP
jgi:hypothetical protein